ncbi:hypothetical protein BB560_006985 [Smittium megazygosporum]|uniref:Uncharacterized protein n=1 Tax=Smittium megazygosporum TaxID=133381 RepID=A0A2T9XZL7_9FUNG|nr:hypothetical protein BB560_006985 [Smittium megazygosporum]
MGTATATATEARAVGPSSKPVITISTFVTHIPGASNAKMGTVSKGTATPTLNNTLTEPAQARAVSTAKSATKTHSAAKSGATSFSRGSNTEMNSVFYVASALVGYIVYYISNFN